MPIPGSRYQLFSRMCRGRRGRELPREPTVRPAHEARGTSRRQFEPNTRMAHRLPLLLFTGQFR